MIDQEAIIRATHGSPDRPLIIGDYSIPCYVLEDGRRVLVQTGIITTLDMSHGGSYSRGGDRLAKFAGQKTLNAFVSTDLLSRTAHPIRFRTPSGHIAYGYEATVLTDLIKVVLKARDDGKLTKQQRHIAERCEVLRDALVGVAIIALVDERTGFQEVRDRGELQRILAKYIAPELLPWTRRFPEEFYVHMFRLWGWRYRPLTVKRPRYVGKLTAQLVYEKLPPGVLDALREKNPADEEGRRKHKHHQFLTGDVGNPHLEKHLAVITTLMRISPTRQAFERHFARAFAAPVQQLSFLPDEDDSEA